MPLSPVVIPVDMNPGNVAVNRSKLIESSGVLGDNLLSSPRIATVKIFSVDNDFMNHIPHELPIIIFERN